ncbi:MAG: thiamine phosphate synthase [Verrucomicrobiae bacterium]|nr:thiamine phosphate synthase [Verrucomicrobiae bacterium]
MKPLKDCRLYAFVDTAWLDGRSPVEVARQLAGGGADLIQLRAKDLDPDAVRPLAEGILRVTREAGVRLVINDHVALARDVGADGVHLGQEDFFDAGHTRVEALRPPGAWMEFGLSSHAPDQAGRAVEAGADYVAVGPVHATPTKPGRPPATLDYVRWAAAHLAIPWFAIGGITLDNLDAVLSAGASRVCVVSAILKHPDPAAACREFRRRMGAI